MIDDNLIKWLLQGDVAIQYQVHRDLLADDRKDLRARIASEGWGKRFLSERQSNGHWGDRFYQPKWISTHYTLLDLKYLNIDPQNKLVRATIELTLDSNKAADGGIRLGPSTAQHSDVCVNGMFLNYAAYFRTTEKRLHALVDVILNEKMPDGGFNCRTTRSGATHSSLHTTLSVLEGLLEFLTAGFTYRKKEVVAAKESAEEFILMHQLFISDRTGEIIKKEFLKLTYPGRWRYDILKALDYFRTAATTWDKRMLPAIEVIMRKRNKNGSWNVQAKHPGQIHFEMEKAGKPSRWNTLRALRVLKYYNLLAT